MKSNILVVGRHPEILQTLLRLINKNDDWSAKGTLYDEEAKALFDSRNFHLILLSSGINEDCERNLRNYFLCKNSSIKIIQHYGGGSGLLSNEIYEALNEIESSVSK